MKTERTEEESTLKTGSKFRFRVLKKGDVALEGAQIFIPGIDKYGNLIPMSYGHLTFKEIPNMDYFNGRSHESYIYEISGPRKISSDEAGIALNYFISPASDTGFLDFQTQLYRKKGVEFVFNPEHKG